jgi:hypothetical protein
MKTIAHFVNVTPKACGLYESTRELCMAECALGYDAKLVDMVGNRAEAESFRLDRGCEIANAEWAKDADVFVLHSAIPEALWNTKPTVMALHGPPEYVLYSELHGHKEGDGGFRTLVMYSTKPWIKKYVTFWERHVPFWKAVYGDDKIAFVQAGRPGGLQPRGRQVHL